MRKWNHEKPMLQQPSRAAQQIIVPTVLPPIVLVFQQEIHRLLSSEGFLFQFIPRLQLFDT
jgi:hypothetical protein